MIDYFKILSKYYQGKIWALNDNSYAQLEWLDSSPKPTQEELDALWIPTQEEILKQDCKTKAKAKIAATDWSVLPDVGLANVAAFETYRATLRELIKNPVAEPTWPTEPEPIWS